MKNSGSKKLSERYVSALFSVAHNAGAVEAVEKDLNDLLALINENAEFRSFLHNPLLSREAQATIAGNLLKKLGANPVTIKFVTLVARSKRLASLGDMIVQFLEKAADARGEISAELVTATPIAADDAKAVANSLGKTYGKQVNLSVRVDPALIGGAVINIGSLQLDSSLAGKLNRLQQKLKAA